VPPLTSDPTVSEAGYTMQNHSAPPAHEHLAPGIRRMAVAASGLVIAFLVIASGAGRAVAFPSNVQGSTPVVGAARPPTTPTTVPTPLATQPSRPTAPVVPGQEATVDIPSIGVSLPVVTGGQDVIDRGVAAHYTGAQWRPPTDPGQPGTYWLAAHNSTHGSPFEKLPAIARGAEIRIVRHDGTVFTYLVTSRDVVGTSTTLDTVYGQNTTTPRILLQTCEGTSRRLLVHGVLTSVTPG
jgi:LPXTG-site transpeptidase (sortase) family protein